MANNFTDVAVALGMFSAQCYTYSGAPEGTKRGTLNPGTGEYPDNGTHEQQSDWMIATFGPGFGFPVTRNASDGGYIPDEVHDNRGPARQHGVPDIPAAVLNQIGLPVPYTLTSRDKLVLTHVPVLFDHIVQLSLNAAGLQGGVASPEGSSAALQTFSGDVSAALARLASTLKS